ncbi:MAG: hypothetical protein JW735_04700 [Prolixibacteraceae bacterium]|jgi:hypothetical protein|nr:hypothetical protein [Prolixibacteraceae bacterium]
MKKIIFIILLFSALTSGAQTHRELFRGGMFLHTGYVKNGLDFPKIDGMVSGIGGKITFRLGNHFRAGTEGYVSNYGYGQNEGQYKLGWGGLLAEYQFSNKRFTPVAGVTFGGGKVHDLYMLKGNFTDNEPDEAIYKIYSSAIVNPHLSVEYSISDHINLVGKIDNIFYLSTRANNNLAKGTRIYFGILFMR